MKFIYFLLLLSLLIGCSPSTESTVEKAIVPGAIVFNERANLFYTGIHNYLTIITPHHRSDEIEVKGSGVNIFKEDERYVCKAKFPGNASISIIDKKNGSLLKEERFRVKRIPDPIARLGRHDSGHLDVATIKGQGGIGAWIDDFIGDNCKTISYNMSLVRPNTPVLKLTNEGARFNGKISEVLYDVKKDDIVLFDEIKCRCPGDRAARKINSLIFWVD